MDFCYGCMQPKRFTVCEHCGYEKTQPSDPNALPVGLVLNNRYIVGKERENSLSTHRPASSYSKIYYGWDKVRNVRVELQEYYPNGSSRQGANRSVVLCKDSRSRDCCYKSIGTFLRMGNSPSRWLREPIVEQIRDFFEANGTWFIVRDILDGENLYQYVKRRGGALPVREASRIILGLTEIVTRLHAIDLVHKGLNPGNVILLKNGQILVRDFGDLDREMEIKCDQDFYHELPLDEIVTHYLPLKPPTNLHNDRWMDVYGICAIFYYCVMGEDPSITGIDWDQVPGLKPYQRAAMNKGTTGCSYVQFLRKEFVDIQ